MHHRVEMKEVERKEEEKNEVENLEWQRLEDWFLGDYSDLNLRLALEMKHPMDPIEIEIENRDNHEMVNDVFYGLESLESQTEEK